MDWQTSFRGSTLFLSPEHGGDAVSGGGHPANASAPAEEAIDEALGREQAGRGKIPGIGVPGSKGSPVGKLREEIARRAQEIWEEEGRPEGRAEEHWLRAEAEIAQRGG